MPYSPRPHCSTAGCPNYAQHSGRCDAHYRAAEARRGTAAERGYSGRRWRSARRTVLKLDPICTCDADDHGHAPFGCMRLSTDADHYPASRKALIAAGARDPDNPGHLRGLCHSCHSHSTAKHQPGGFGR